MRWFPWLSNIRAASKPKPKPIRLRASGSRLQLQAAAAGAPDDAPKTFSMLAYTGGLLSLDNYPAPVIVDLTGLSIPSGAMPIFRDHDRQRIVGHTTAIAIRGGQVHIDGVISGVGEDAQEVTASATNGFPWEASIGADPQQMEPIEAGRTVSVNGQSFTGPVFVARKATLVETSFVPLGADQGGASATVNAAAPEGTMTMQFEEWLKGKGFDPATISDALRTELQAIFDAEQAANSGMPASEGASTADTPLPLTEAGATRPGIQARQPQRGTVPVGGDAQGMIQALRNEQARVARIEQIAAAFPEIRQKAIAEGWTPDTAELHVLRARRPQGPAIHGSTTQAVGDDVILAALCQAGKLRSLEQRFQPATLEAADKQFRGRIGLQELLLQAAWANGYHGTSFKANHREVIRAAFSSNSLSGILSNVANKFMLDAFMAVDKIWREIARISPVSDFKTITRYRLVGNGRFEQVGPTGELKHARLSDESFSNKANTYGEIYAITREDQINDDLGALTQVPSMIGRDAALKLNDVFWTKFLDNAAFFTTLRKNLVGAGSIFGIDGLSLVEQGFLDQVGPDKKPLGIAPDRILVPTALNTKANTLMRSTEVRNPGEDSAYGTANPHAGKFKVLSSPYLSNAAYTGSSSASYYMLTDPANLAAIEVVFLNGQETPTIEESEADFNTLGILMRGFFDFGVELQEWLAAQKATGEAAE